MTRGELENQKKHTLPYLNVLTTGAGAENPQGDGIKERSIADTTGRLARILPFFCSSCDAYPDLGPRAFTTCRPLYFPQVPRSFSSPSVPPSSPKPLSTTSCIQPMSDSSDKSWSGSPSAPRIPASLYFEEKVNFAGDFVAIILYGAPLLIPCVCQSVLTLYVRFAVPGIVIVLFFQCMGALLDPLNRRREGIRWGLVVHTTAMFSFVTIATAMGLNLQSISRIDNREFPGADDGTLPPGPFGYKFLIYSKAISIIPNFTFQLNQWLVDGLLVSHAPKSVTHVPIYIPKALSLLYYLCPEPLGHFLSLSDVPCLFGFVLNYVQA